MTPGSDDGDEIFQKTYSTRDTVEIYDEPWATDLPVRAPCNDGPD